MTVKELTESLQRCSRQGRSCAGCPQYEDYHCKTSPEKLMGEAARVINLYSRAVDGIYHGNETKEF